MRTLGLKRVHVIRLEEGDELMSELERIASSLDIRGALVNGIGGVDRARVAVFDPEKGEYRIREVTGFHEMASMIGNISRKADGTIALHVHVVLGSEDEVIAGHLVEARVRGTAELFILEVDGELRRTLKKGRLTLLDV